ncbi:MAG: Glu/Leu/Phe/Val dehydrogenase [Alphaproteobacteria bacterium]|nr:Glu/Leu/Phe/Val dehydrogenase [Alphaproteobacteria bacterium]
MYFEHVEFDSHEKILFIHDAVSNLRAIIAIHDTRLGPALGGTRFWNYADSADALGDALRLSKGMTYKNALAGLPFGGGKAVVLIDPAQGKSPALLRAYAEALNQLDGQFITGEDVGMTVADVDQIRVHTPFIAGSSTTRAASGDPSRFTAEGVYRCLLETAEVAFGSMDLNGARIGVQGLGAVGWKLAEKLYKAGATLLVSDLDRTKTRRAVDVFNAIETAPEWIMRQEMDIFAPCGLGRILSDESVAALKAKAVAGAANNQLSHPGVDQFLSQRGILYAPDFVINAGGVLNVAAEAQGDYDCEKVMKQVHRIPKRLRSIFDRSKATGRSTGAIADVLAQEILHQVNKAA